MPEWLLKQDNYIPPKGKDDFINKSILSLCRVLSKIKLQTQYKTKRFEINSIVKMISSLILIITISLTRNFAFIVTMDVLLLLMVSLLNVDEIEYIIRMGTIVSIFTFIILVPSMMMGNINNSLLIVIKVLSSITTVNILACTTKWNDLVIALKIFLVPDIIIFVIDITIKYIMILGEFSLNMMYSLKIRSVGKSKNKNASISGIIGTMFIKSKEMAEDMYGAMECRGFTGEYKLYQKFNFRIMDFLCIITDVVIIYTYLKLG